MAEPRKNGTSTTEFVLLSGRKPEADVAERQTIYDLKQKYKDAVLFEIYEDENLLHSVLAHRVLVSASGLNAIIKKLNEAQPPPIHINRQGKFTLYSLEEAGKAYVRDELLQTMASNDQDIDIVNNIFSLLRAFKDQNPRNWDTILNNILKGEEDLAEFEEGEGFIKELSNYYSHYDKGAELLLSLSVVDRDLQKRIAGFLKENISRNFSSAWEVLNYWEFEDTFELYRLIDALFEAIERDEGMPDGDGFSLTNVELHIERVIDKLQASLFKALFRKMSKEEAVHLWLGYGIEKHLAIYLADKYFTYCLKYEQSREENKRCI